MVVFMSMICVWGLGEHVSYCMKFAGDMFDSEVVFLQCGEPVGYSLVDLLGVFPEREVGMVGENCDWDLHGCDVWPPVFQGFDDCQQFPFIDVVVSLGWGERC